MAKGKREGQLKQADIFYGYVKLFFLFIVTILVVLFIRNLYLRKSNYQLNIPVIRETIQQEVNQSEIYNFVRENPNAVLYFGAVSDSDCRTFEADFNQVIQEKKLEDVITYFNLEKTDSIKSFFKEFNKFYGCKLDDYPSIVIFKDGRVEDILIVPVGSNNSHSVVIEFLENHQVDVQ